MAEHIMVTMAKAVFKRKLRIGKISGKERVILAQLGMQDRVPTMMSAANVEPMNIDPNYNYVILSKGVEPNLELFDKFNQRVQLDQVVTPFWVVLMAAGAAEMGTKFKASISRPKYLLAACAPRVMIPTPNRPIPAPTFISSTIPTQMKNEPQASPASFWAVFPRSLSSKSPLFPVFSSDIAHLVCNRNE